MSSKEEGPTRDTVGWLFLIGVAFLVGAPVIMGLEKLVAADAVAPGFPPAVDRIGFSFLLAAILMVGHANLRNAFDWRTAHRHLPDLVPYFRNRQIRFGALTLLSFFLATGLRRLDDAGSTDFTGAAIGVLGGLVLLFTLDHRFLPDDPDRGQPA